MQWEEEFVLPKEQQETEKERDRKGEKDSEF